MHRRECQDFFFFPARQILTFCHCPMHLILHEVASGTGRENQLENPRRQFLMTSTDNTEQKGKKCREGWNSGLSKGSRAHNFVLPSLRVLRCNTFITILSVFHRIDLYGFSWLCALGVWECCEN